MQTLIAGVNTILPNNTVTVSLDYALDRGALDITAYLLDAQSGKVRGDADMIFYGQTQTPNQSVRLETATNRAVLHVDTSILDASVGEIAVCATIDGAENLAPFRHLQMQLHCGGQYVAMAQTNMSGRSEAALIVLEFYLHKEQWKCRWVEQGFKGGLQPLAEHFGVDIADESPAAPPPKSQPSPQPSVNLSKITLDKQNSAVYLSKKAGGFDKISINLNWNRNPSQNSGFLARLTDNKAIDLDLGAMTFG